MSILVVGLIPVLIITDKANYLYSCINDKAIFLCLNDYFCSGWLVFTAKTDNFKPEDIVAVGDVTQHLNPRCPFFYIIYHLNIQQQLFSFSVGVTRMDWVRTGERRHDVYWCERRECGGQTLIELILKVLYRDGLWSFSEVLAETKKLS